MAVSLKGCSLEGLRGYQFDECEWVRKCGAEECSRFSNLRLVTSVL